MKKAISGKRRRPSVANLHEPNFFGFPDQRLAGRSGSQSRTNAIKSHLFDPLRLRFSVREYFSANVSYFTRS